MSKKLQRESLIHEDIEYFVRCIPIYNFGVRLVERSLVTAQDALVLHFVLWYSLLSVKDKSWDYARWFKSTPRIDLDLYLGCLKSADDLLLSIVDGRSDIASYECFKHTLRSTYPLCGAILSPLKQEMKKLFDYKEEEQVRLVHQLLCFCTRLTFEDFPPNLEIEAVENFLRIDGRLSVPPNDLPGVVIRRWFRDYTWKIPQWYFKHGNGATADCKRTSLQSKYTNLGRDVRTNYIDTQLDIVLPFERPVLDRCSRLACVPKSATKLRTICMEPASLQWYQQGFFRSIDDYLKHHPYLRNRISLHEQEHNTLLAWEGSISSDFSTIDLSNASDSVSWECVKTWFRHTDLYPAILCSRSNYCMLPTGERVPLKKVSGMGSSLCFPIECIVFASIVEISIQECGANPRTSRYRVYGDDIVVEREYSDCVIKNLLLFGFEPNLTKTFTGRSDFGCFRESCGGEFLNGLDITPIRLSRWFRGLSSECEVSSWPASCVEMANRCYTRLPELRRLIVKKLLTLPRVKMPLFDETGDKGLFSLLPDNRHLILRTHKSYQSEFYLHGSFQARATGRHNQDIQYYEWLRRSVRRERLIWPEDRIDVEDRATPVGTWRIARTYR